MQISERELMLHRKLADKDDEIRSLQVEVERLKTDHISKAKLLKALDDVESVAGDWRWDGEDSVFEVDIDMAISYIEKECLEGE